MPCELCGRECKGGKEAIIDGAKMFVCPDCLKYAEGFVPPEPGPTKSPVQASRVVMKKPATIERDIYKDKTMAKELVTNWNQRIEQARKKKGLTREELGFRIGERTVTIAKLENGDLRPSDQTITKLEKELSVQLMEEIKEVPTGSQKGTRAGFTLGDFIKTDK
ncbi:MAG: multiprotein bridging factor aMBF1 [Candidatus Thermoplasmatota archaeon]